MLQMLAFSVSQNRIEYGIVESQRNCSWNMEMELPSGWGTAFMEKAAFGDM